MERCAYCHDDLDAAPAPCAGCGTLLHDDCRAEHGECPTLGCGGDRRVFTIAGVRPWVATLLVVMSAAMPPVVMLALTSRREAREARARAEAPGRLEIRPVDEWSPFPMLCGGVSFGLGDLPSSTSGKPERPAGVIVAPDAKTSPALVASIESSTGAGVDSSDQTLARPVAHIVRSW